DGWVPQHPDLGPTPPADLAGVDTMCGTGMVDCGPIADMAPGSARHFSDNNSYDLYVCRDSVGIFALSASCPHAGCTVDPQNGGFSCPCHGATFAFDGSQPTSPARSSLHHYVVCIDTATGHVHVDPNATVPSATRF